MMKLQESLSENKKIFYWLCLVTFLVMLMVAIGGLTRLTNSGLSIVEWKPITGIFPPIGQLEWAEEFEKYKTSPEFKLLNSHLDVKGFKQIFWLEYIHRLVARFLGLVFFIPAIYFLKNNMFSKETKKSLMVISIIGICQGFMGWYMVKSGLVNAPYVSHFRLTLHLLFALAIFLILLDSILFLMPHKKLKLPLLAKICLGFTIIQISLGGLVAGMDAGLVYNSFPKMGEHYIPSEFLEADISEYLLNGAIVQFFHRIGAYILTITTLYWSLVLLNEKQYVKASALLLVIILQFSLGVVTLLEFVPIILASTHQVVAFIFAGVVLICGRLSDK